jgi:hypothetical protein
MLHAVLCCLAQRSLKHHSPRNTICMFVMYHAAARSQSAFLRCLSQLDGAAWAQVLLPLLHKQGSAAAVALTCRTLRTLCHSNVQNLDLSSLHDSSDTDELEDTLRSLPSGCFSSCRSVQLLLEAETSYHSIPYLLPSIARWVSLHVAIQRGGREGEAAVCVHRLSGHSDAAATATRSCK